MKNLLFKIIISGLVIYLVVLFIDLKFIKDVNQNFLNFCNNTNLSTEMLECVESNKLSSQQQYDLYYNKSDKYSDGKFYIGFSLSYNKCSLDKSCNLYEKDKFTQMYQRCIKDNEAECVNLYLSNKEISQEDVLLLSNAINKSIKNKDDSVCLQFSDIYKKFTKLQKEEINTNIENKCKWK